MFTERDIEFEDLKARVEKLEKMFDMPHGSTRYANGCRCQLCRGARAKEVKFYRDRRKRLADK